METLDSRPQPKKKKEKIVIVETSDAVDSRARDVADKRMSATRAETSGVRGFFRRIWKHNLAQEYYRQREICQARSAIIEQKNIYAPDGGSMEEHQTAMDAIIERFSHEYEEDMIHEGEDRAVINKPDNDLKIRIEQLVKRYAAGSLDDTRFNAEKEQILARVNETRNENGERIIQSGRMYADNIFQIAEQCKQAIEHGQRLDDLDFEFEIVVGRARTGVRTEANYNRVDRMIDYINRTPIGVLVNETTIAAAVSVTYGLAAKGLVAGARAGSKIAFGVGGLVVGGGIAGAVAGLKENKRLKDERRQHAREMAMGNKVGPDSPRRQEMETFRYETKDANNMKNDLQNSIEKFRFEPTPENYDKLTKSLAEIETRIRLSDRQIAGHENMDFISYSHEKQMEKERTELDIARAQAKVFLTRLAKGEELDKNGNPLGNNIDLGYSDKQGLKDHLEKLITDKIEMDYGDEICKKDRLFNGMKRKKIAIAALKGAGIGIAVGAAVQEGFAAMNNNIEGLFENKQQAFSADATPRFTFLNYLYRYFQNDLPRIDNSSMRDVFINGKNFQLPKGVDLSPNPDGSFDLVMKGKHIASHLTFDKNTGELTNEAKAILADNDIRLKTGMEFHTGGNPHEAKIGGHSYKLPAELDFSSNPDGTYKLVNTSTGKVLADSLKANPDGSLTDDAKDLIKSRGGIVQDNSKTITGNAPASVKQLVEQREDIFQKIKRTLWYDNNTPKPVFDKNELRLLWGGLRGSGIDKDGNFVFNVKKMLKDGSFHGKFSVDAQKALAQGKLKLLLTASQDTQGKVVEIEIDTEGNAKIKPDSEIAKMFFSIDEKGRAVYKGRFAEVAEMMDKKDPKTAAQHVRILATHEGKGITTPDPEPIPKIVTTTDLDIPEEKTKLDIPAEPEVDGPWVIPVLGRRPLEPIRGYTEYITGYFGISAEDEKYFKSRRSKSLDNPKAKLDCLSETFEYFKKQKEEWMNELDELNSQINQPMHSDCKTVICIPAAGHQEGRNIYKTLSYYKNQKNKDGTQINHNSYEILIFVNYPEDKIPDNTLDEIKRFMQENPNIPIRVANRALERSQAKIGNIRKYLNDLALLRNQNRGNLSKDILLVSNDVDCKGISEYYISSMVDQFEKNPDSDGVLGKIDWESDAFAKSPLLYLGTRLFQYLDIIQRHQKVKSNIGSSGANFAFRGSIYAAVGGYDSTDVKCEDVVLGNMIKSARKGSGSKPIVFGGARTKIVTSSRRAVDALKSGLAPAQMWSKQFSPDDKLREFEWALDENENILNNLDNKAQQDRFVSTLQKFINSTLQEYKIKAASNNAKKALNFLGIKKFKIHENQVEIQSFDELKHLIRVLQAYREKYGIQTTDENAEDIPLEELESEDILEDSEMINRENVLKSIGLGLEDEQLINNLDNLSDQEMGDLLKRAYKIDNLLYSSVNSVYPDKIFNRISGKYSPQEEGEILGIVQKLFENYNSRIEAYVKKYRPYLRVSADLNENEKEYASGFLELFSRNEGEKLEQFSEELNNKLISDMSAISVFSRTNMTGKWASWDIARRYAVALKAGETNFFENTNIKKEMSERRLGWEFVYHYKKNYINRKTNKGFREEFDSACMVSPKAAEIKALIDELIRMKTDESVAHDKLISLSRMACEALGYSV